ncbi:MAG: polyamine aminopropyltransferase [Armatimonadetes bacterium]|nr:polyamine aminopropyltransferase [Armatimonadota bacterium]
MPGFLLLSVFVVATCGLVYELVAGTLASYLLGDSVLQFSTVIGTYLFAMGVGSYASRFLERGLVARFIQLQLLVGLIGGCSAAVLYLSFSYATGFRLILYGLVFAIGVLVGMEIPLLLRILKDQLSFRELVSQVLALDYVGALAASLLFPLLLVPFLGLIRTAFLFGILNVGVAIAFLRVFRQQRSAPLLAQGWLIMGLMIAGMIGADRLTALAEANLFSDEVVIARSTPYQRIVITRARNDVSLFLNGNLQFASQDEYRYHEALVHPALSFCEAPRRVLILGGGDGLAAREVLRDPRVEQVTLVDLDPEITRLFSSHPMLRELNRNSLNDPRLEVINADAFVWLEQNRLLCDVVVVDFPDPTNYSVGKLYTNVFYSLLERRLAPGGVAAVQCSSPLFARRSYWCIVATMRSVGLEVTPYHTFVPSFGEWGFALASRERLGEPRPLPADLRFLDRDTFRGMFEFPRDMQPVSAEVNRLFNQVLVHYYQEDWETLSR